MPAVLEVAMWGPKAALCCDMRPLGNTSRPGREGHPGSGVGLGFPESRMSLFPPLTGCSHSAHTGG